MNKYLVLCLAFTHNTVSYRCQYCKLQMNKHRHRFHQEKRRRGEKHRRKDRCKWTKSYLSCWHYSIRLILGPAPSTPLQKTVLTSSFMIPHERFAHISCLLWLFISSSSIFAMTRYDNSFVARCQAIILGDVYLTVFFLCSRQRRKSSFTLAGNQQSGGWVMCSSTSIGPHCVSSLPSLATQFLVSFSTLLGI